MGFYITDTSINNVKIKSEFVQTNSFSYNTTIEPGEYILITTTFYPNTFGNFTITLYTEHAVAFTHQ